MAGSHVDRLKNPRRLWMWNTLVATQPPRSAPTMPIRQVRRRPCDLLPGISILAINPAAKPRTIQAMIPITDSLVSDRMTYAVVSHAGWIAVGEEFTHDSRHPLLSSTFVGAGHESLPKKNPGPAVHRACRACNGLGPELVSLYAPRGDRKSRPWRRGRDAR